MKLQKFIIHSGILLTVLFLILLLYVNDLYYRMMEYYMIEENTQRIIKEHTQNQQPNKTPFTLPPKQPNTYQYPGKK